MARHKIALIGLGMAVAPHAKSLADLAERVEVVAAYSRTDARRQAFAASFPFPLSDDLDAILTDGTIDAVAILTPPNTHLELVRRAAAAGKHILLEKPLDISLERAEAIVAACNDAGVALAIMLQHRFRPAGLTLADRLADGSLGPIVGCSTSIQLWRPQSYYDEPGRGTRARDGGGVLLTQGIHTLDLMLSLAGPVAEVTGYATTTPVHRMETEDMACAAVRYANGAIGTIDATTAAYPGFPERITLACVHGTAVLAGTELTIQYHNGEVTQIEADSSAGGTGADPMAFPHDYHRALIGDFLDAIEQGRAPAVDGNAGLAVHRLIEGMLKTAETGRPVRL